MNGGPGRAGRGAERGSLSHLSPGAVAGRAQVAQAAQTAESTQSRKSSVSWARRSIKGGLRVRGVPRGQSGGRRTPECDERLRHMLVGPPEQAGSLPLRRSDRSPGRRDGWAASTEVNEVAGKFCMRLLWRRERWRSWRAQGPRLLVTLNRSDARTRDTCVPASDYNARGRVAKPHAPSPATSDLRVRPRASRRRKPSTRSSKPSRHQLKTVIEHIVLWPRGWRHRRER